ncbi:hypothetical protein ALC53_01138, partial [Atta colombica]
KLWLQAYDIKENISRKRKYYSIRASLPTELRLAVTLM